MARTQPVTEEEFAAYMDRVETFMFEADEMARRLSATFNSKDLKSQAQRTSSLVSCGRAILNVAHQISIRASLNEVSAETAIEIQSRIKGEG